MTYFLATVMGWYLVIVSLLLLLRHDLVLQAMKEIAGHHAIMLVVGVFTLIIGLLLVASHNFWLMDWPVVITIFAWLVLISGIVRLFFPERVYKIWNNTMNKSQKLMISGVITLIIGLFLLYKVYFG